MADHSDSSSAPIDSVDYVWRFKLDGQDEEVLYEDALTEMVRKQLKALLGVALLTDSSGSELLPTGFKFMNRLTAEPYAIYDDETIRGAEDA